MAGQRSIDGNRGGLQIADFAEHDHVRRLAKHGAQCAGKSEAHGFAHLHLVDAGQQIFDRVLDGDDFAVWPVDEIQTGIKCGRFARPGGAGHEQDAIRQTNQPLKGLLVVRKKT